MTLVELVITATIGLVLVFAIGLLVDGGNRAWLRTYEYAHGTVNEDTVTLTTTFGSIGRRANRTDYILYRMDRGIFTPVTPGPGQGESVLAGEAVEFRYWDVPLDASDSHKIMDTDVTATAYALFYLDGDQLKVDYGPCPPGAVPAGGGQRHTTNVTTHVLADNVSAGPDAGPFSHTLSGGVGQGCVRLNVVLTDPSDNDTTTVTSAALMRNIWPR